MATARRIRRARERAAADRGRTSGELRARVWRPQPRAGAQIGWHSRRYSRARQRHLPGPIA